VGDSLLTKYFNINFLEEKNRLLSYFRYRNKGSVGLNQHLTCRSAQNFALSTLSLDGFSGAGCESIGLHSNWAAVVLSLSDNNFVDWVLTLGNFPLGQQGFVTNNVSFGFSVQLLQFDDVV